MSSPDRAAASGPVWLSNALTGYPAKDAVYALHPQGGDVFGFGGVKRLVRSETDLIVNGWRVVA